MGKKVKKLQSQSPKVLGQQTSEPCGSKSFLKTGLLFSEEGGVLSVCLSVSVCVPVVCAGGEVLTWSEWRAVTITSVEKRTGKVISFTNINPCSVMSGRKSPDWFRCKIRSGKRR